MRDSSDRRLRWTRPWSRRRSRSRSRRLTRNGFAQSDSNCVDAPAFAGAAVVAGHSPAEPAAWREEWQGYYCTNKTPGITAPRLTTCDRTTSVGADCAVITTQIEAAANGENVLKCISTIKTHLQYASIEPNVWVHVRRFEIEIVLEEQLDSGPRNRKVQRVEPFVAYDTRIINERSIGRCLCSRIRCDPERRRSQRVGC
jgi:hypothetical protein